MQVKCGLKPNWTMERSSASLLLEVMAMNGEVVEILLVEDNPSDIELTLHVFEQHNITNKVHVVRDGIEALEFIFCTGRYAGRSLADGPRFILLDLKLPFVDGREVLRRVKADAATSAIPVVVITSSREERDVMESYHLGVNSYIAKPVDFEQLTETVRQIGLYWLIINEPPPLLGDGPSE
jgi:two-component system, response regulator